MPVLGRKAARTKFKKYADRQKEILTEVRLAQAGDAKAIAQLYLEVWRNSSNELKGSGAASASTASSQDVVNPDELEEQRTRFEDMIDGEARTVLVAIPGPGSLHSDPDCATRTPVCGFISYGASYTLEGHGEVMQLFVHPSWQRRGVGNSLLEFATNAMIFETWAEQGLHVWASRDNPGNRIYEKNGWVATGNEKTIKPTLGGGEAVPVVEYRKEQVEIPSEDGEPLWKAPWHLKLSLAVLLGLSAITCGVLAEMSWPGIWRPIKAVVFQKQVKLKPPDGPVPNVGTLFKVNPAKVGVAHAGCLDGSFPAYYLRPQWRGPNKTKWLLYFQGGGWCSMDKDAYPANFRPSLVENCRLRSNRSMGSTLYDEPEMDFSYKGMFSQDPAVNPTMHDWNVVFLRYCDGSSFSSKSPLSIPSGHADRDKPGYMHFEGLGNLRAIMESLLRGTIEDERDPRYQELSDATEVVVSGCSAGGLAAAMHVERIQERLPKAMVVGLLDSAMFPNWYRKFDENIAAKREGRRLEDHGHGDRPDMIWPLHQQLRMIFEKFGVTASIPERCIEIHSHAGAWRCFFLEHLLPVVAETIPVFVLQSRFDSSNIMDLEWTGIEGFGNEVAKRLSLAESFVREPKKGRRPPIGLYLDACFHHCMKWDSNIRISGQTQPEAFAKFMHAAEKWHARRTHKGGFGNKEPDHGTVKLWLQQDYSNAGDLPCKDCCVGEADGANPGSGPQAAAEASEAEAAYANDLADWQAKFSGGMGFPRIEKSPPEEKHEVI